MWTYGVAIDLRNHVGTALLVLSAAIVVALIDRYVWDWYFEKRKHTPIPHFPRQIVALVVYLITLLMVLWYGYHASHWLTGLLTGSGIAAIVLGLAGQNLLSGVIAGMSLQINRPYKVSDWLKFSSLISAITPSLTRSNTTLAITPGSMRPTTRCARMFGTNSNGSGSIFHIPFAHCSWNGGLSQHQRATRKPALFYAANRFSNVCPTARSTIWSSSRSSIISGAANT